MIGEYVRPTNFELVGMSDAIVVATARDGRQGEHGGRVTFEVGEAVKGEASRTVELPGDLGSPGPSDLADISSSHPEGHAGPCNRTTFRRGGRYLLFLEKDEDGQFRRAGDAFSRINEDYAGENNVWMRTVRRYVRLQAGAPPMEQLAVLERLAESGLGPSGEKLVPAEIADIRDHLSSLSPYKPTAYLLAAYAALEQGKVPRHGVRPGSADREQSQAEALSRHLLGETPEQEAQGLAAQRRRVLTSLVNGDHPEAKLLFDRLAARTPEEPETIGLVLRFLAKQGGYDRAFHWIETRLMNQLPRLEPRVARKLILDVAQVQHGEGEGKEPWRSNARAASVWPELALSLYWYQVNSFGADEAIHFGEVFETLPHSDYRARPLLTLALAADYSDGIADWAVSELRDDAKRKAWEALPEETREGATDPGLLPLQVLLTAWEEEHGAVLEEVFCQSELRRLLLIAALGEVGEDIYEDLFGRIAASPLSEDERDLLPSALAKWTVRNSRIGDWSDEEAKRLAAALNGARSEGKPIVCAAGRR
jgi:hypothetical protein